MRKVALVTRRVRWRDAVDELRRHLVDEPRRLARLVLAEHAPPRGSGQHELCARARHPDVAQAPLFLELLLVVARSRMGEQAFFEAREDDDRKLEPLRAVERHQPHARVGRALCLIRV